MTDEQEKSVEEAGIILNKAFPGEGMQICFNLSPTHDNVNYNIKTSGIIGKKRS